MITNRIIGYHGTEDVFGSQRPDIPNKLHWERQVHYKFELHQHPFVQELTRRLINAGVGGLQAADTDYQKDDAGNPIFLADEKTRQPKLFKEFFQSAYDPNTELVDLSTFPVKDLDFSSGGAYAIYNWELFFHVPFLIATHLSKNQRFAEAQRWLHYIFDPTDDSADATPERFWKVRPFQSTDVKKIEDILMNLATGDDEALLNETLASINAWRDAPFRPHVVARYRQQAYMIKTVMLYLDNLIAWGDSLFRQDTGEAIDEAMMVYVLAANVLGVRPQAVPKKSKPKWMTYAQLRNSIGNNEFGFVLQEIESDLSGDMIPSLPEGAVENSQLVTLSSLSQTPYFAVPRNDKLLSYWDTVADRLFKIRNSLNIQGTFRQLALFDPPIDPAMLARAAAAGLDVGAIVNGLNQPLPLVRFQFLIQKAAEIVQEVKSLGNNLLSAMEKEDGEAMTCLRAKNERQVMAMVEQIKYGQLQEAVKSKEGLLKSVDLAVEKFTYYELQLGKKVDDIQKSIPNFESLDRDDLAKMKLKVHEATLAKRKIEVDIASGLGQAGAAFLTGGKFISSHEALEAYLLEAAQVASDIANITNIASSVGHIPPTFSVVAAPLGVGMLTEYGGKDIGWTIGATANSLRALAERLNFEARRASRIDSISRREMEWSFQSNIAALEVTQIFKQLRAAEIREAIAELELKNHRQQMKHADEIESFLNEEGTDRNGKKTNRALYAWMKREVKGLYAQCFQFAFDIARKAERALQHELGNSNLNYLQAGYLAGKEGLLAGEKLHLDIKRMEMAYHELNQREYELTKHVSLLQIDPLALIKLRKTGRCDVELPESLFDMDGPGHYFRRIKTVAVSIPCVSGPYASVNCTLTLQKSRIRKTSVVDNGQYARRDDQDDRFSDSFSSLQSIVTSSAQNDSGLFETNLRDERYLPFENSGVISKWQLQLPADPSKGDPAQFDYDTISDVILHMRYTAREGGEGLATKAREELKTLITKSEAAGQVRLFSMRYEFPAEWSKLKQSKQQGVAAPFDLKIQLRNEHYPYWCQDLLTTVADIQVFGRLGKTAAMDQYGFRQAELQNLKPVGEIPLTLTRNDYEDVWFVVKWK